MGTGTTCVRAVVQPWSAPGGALVRAAGQPVWYSTSRHRRAVRRLVLRQQPWCLCTYPGCRHGAVCHRLATVADHFPLECAELVATGERNPFQARYMRSLCDACYFRYRAADPPRQPGR